MFRVAAAVLAGKEEDEMQYSQDELNIYKLNDDIESFIEAYDGTYVGMEIKNMFENGSSYESICDRLGWDIKEYLL